ncbi:MAG: aspartate ammonia-lyase [Victivallaceae bacterium]
MSVTRIEEDSLGAVELPADCLYGIQTARAAANFELGFRPVHPELILAMAAVKKAAMSAYRDLETDLARRPLWEAAAAACDRIAAGEARDAFPVDALQGGAGTSLHMNVNEVIANLTLQILGDKPGNYRRIDPLDMINRGQSTNDVYPTALRIASIRLLRRLSEECARLQESLQRKENAFAAVAKLGRTEWMDAVPITLGEEFGAFAQAIGRDRWRLYKVEERLRQTNLGGTAVGTGTNADKKYVFRVTELLREQTGIGLARAEYPMDLTQNNDVFVEVSGLLKALAVNLCKISGDLRRMNSGPKGGLGEIRLAELQAGSTIMPGKVNPVIPEMATQAAFRVIANDGAITMAAAAGEFELNAFLPLIADSLLESLSLLLAAVRLFRERGIDGVAACPGRCAELLDGSYAFAAKFVPLLGYHKVAEIIRASAGDVAAARAEMEKLR